MSPSHLLQTQFQTWRPALQPEGIMQSLLASDIHACADGHTMPGMLLPKRVLAFYNGGVWCYMPFNCSCICGAGDAACHPFEDDNRAGVDGTLHSIVAIRDRGAGRNFIGLTFRIGRHVPGKYNPLV